jgi:hypothetical protein
MEADVVSLDSGCCGMAGPFGFEKEKYPVSQALAERVLLPAVEAASPQDVILTDGFSCREAVAQNTNRAALHVAELLDLASRKEVVKEGNPEAILQEPIKRAKRQARIRIGIVAGAGAALLIGLLCKIKSTENKWAKALPQR